MTPTLTSVRPGLHRQMLDFSECHCHCHCHLSCALRYVSNGCDSAGGEVSFDTYSLVRSIPGTWLRKSRCERFGSKCSRCPPSRRWGRRRVQSRFATITGNFPVSSVFMGPRTDPAGCGRGSTRFACVSVRDVACVSEPACSVFFLSIFLVRPVALPRSLSERLWCTCILSERRQPEFLSDDGSAIFTFLGYIAGLVDLSHIPK